MGTQKYYLFLSDEERKALCNMIELHTLTGEFSKEAIKRAQICLELDESNGRIPPPVKELALKYDISEISIRRYRKRFASESVLFTIPRQKRIYQTTMLYDLSILSIYVTPIPRLKPRWTAKMIVEKLKTMDKHISEETVRRRLNVYRNDPYFGKAMEYLDSLSNSQRKECKCYSKKGPK